MRLTLIVYKLLNKEESVTEAIITKARCFNFYMRNAH